MWHIFNESKTKIELVGKFTYNQFGTFDITPSRQKANYWDDYYEGYNYHESYPEYYTIKFLGKINFDKNYHPMKKMKKQRKDRTYSITVRYGDDGDDMDYFYAVIHKIHIESVELERSKNDQLEALMLTPEQKEELIAEKHYLDSHLLKITKLKYSGRFGYSDEPTQYWLRKYKDEAISLRSTKDTAIEKPFEHCANCGAIFFCQPSLKRHNKKTCNRKKTHIRADFGRKKTHILSKKKFLRPVRNAKKLSHDQLSSDEEADLRSAKKDVLSTSIHNNINHFFDDRVLKWYDYCRNKLNGKDLDGQDIKSLSFDEFEEKYFYLIDKTDYFSEHKRKNHPDVTTTAFHFHGHISSSSDSSMVNGVVFPTSIWDIFF